jgi:hypothetical protein
MRRNLKKWAADGESPAIQYVLRYCEWRYHRAGVRNTYMVEIIMVGINRRGIKSKTKRESNHAVGLQNV